MSDPQSTRDRLIANIENTIWNALEQQDGPWVDREMGMVDASGAGLDMTAVAAAVADIFVDSEDDCSWCHSPCAVGGWSEPVDVGSIVQSEPNQEGDNKCER
ncbi:hypothetical protein SEA_DEMSCULPINBOYZ_102 [Mycobacterium phage Demsculpinboyz]|uniref:Uncharacterized protein n=1 Tax=Mycobacterium phage Demsculpinboyz TaxID=2041528 RepID=A0A2D1GAD7_9CAUD|nr:hypothetical protein I5I02_gp102 [Mycobacterium phage Demsculpinboyz]ATN88697.1 hypothetical protein SEA_DEMSCULPINBOYZ_102 [Mycobacterium phage Demsculpinboyz]